jgi:hypothetical protein
MKVRCERIARKRGKAAGLKKDVVDAPPELEEVSAPAQKEVIGAVDEAGEG